MKRVAISQSNYIPWKGYFDIIASVDEFILYDDMQFTKNDWRNRNKIKSPSGMQWLSVPVGSNINRRIRDVEILDARWQEKHWKSMEASYGRCAYFDEISALLKEQYLDKSHRNLSILNRTLIELVCDFLGINTRISNSWDYELGDGKTERLVSLCLQSDATDYVSGKAAQGYIDESKFRESNLNLTWFDYSGYPEYPQRWGEFVHQVSIVDLLFNCGKTASTYMQFGSK